MRVTQGEHELLVVKLQQVPESIACTAGVHAALRHAALQNPDGHPTASAAANPPIPGILNHAAAGLQMGT
jgi:hypothetical protein